METFNNLWKKETTENGNRYVDIFACIKEDEFTAGTLKIISEKLGVVPSVKKKLTINLQSIEWMDIKFLLQKIG